MLKCRTSNRVCQIMEISQTGIREKCGSRSPSSQIERLATSWSPSRVLTALMLHLLGSHFLLFILEFLNVFAIGIVDLGRLIVTATTSQADESQCGQQYEFSNHPETPWG